MKYRHPCCSDMHMQIIVFKLIEIQMVIGTSRGGGHWWVGGGGGVGGTWRWGRVVGCNMVARKQAAVILTII